MNTQYHSRKSNQKSVVTSTSFTAHPFNHLLKQVLSWIPMNSIPCRQKPLTSYVNLINFNSGCSRLIMAKNKTNYRVQRLERFFWICGFLIWVFQNQGLIHTSKIYQLLKFVKRISPTRKFHTKTLVILVATFLATTMKFWWVLHIKYK